MDSKHVIDFKKGICFFTLLLVCLFLGDSALSSEPPALFDAQLILDSPEQIDTLKPFGLTITSRHGDVLTLQEDMASLDLLMERGYNVTILGAVDGAKPVSGYYTFATAVTELQSLSSTYPNLTKLFSIGTTVDGRDLWVLKISDNADTDEAEPALMYNSAIHGDEKIGFEVTFAFIHKLLEDYSTDTDIAALVDDFEIFVLPMANPDGVEANRRTNGNFKDLNRSFPFLWEGSGAWTLQPEVQHIMNFGMDYDLLMGIDYHGGAELINYNWDAVYTLSPDDEIENWVSDVYAAQSGYSKTNGAAWYVADGSLEDWYHGSLGAASIILEVSNAKAPILAQLQGYIDQNVPSMIDWAEAGRNGIWGTVSDDSSGDPLEAVIFIDDYLPVHASVDHGDFYKALPAGTYDVRIWANGYDEYTVDDVVVPSNGHAVIEADLSPALNPMVYAMRCVINMRSDSSDNPTNVSLPMAALGPLDSSSFSLGVGGWAIFDLGEDSVLPTDDEWWLVFGDGVSDGFDEFDSYAAEDWTGPWVSLGPTSHGGMVKLSTLALSNVRYVKIVDDGDGPNTGATPGADIDAIRAVYDPVLDDDDDSVDDDDDTTDDDDDSTDDDDDSTDDDDDSTDDDTTDDDDDDSDDDIINDDDDQRPRDDDDDDSGGCCG